jgi:hypothetical protein
MVKPLDPKIGEWKVLGGLANVEQPLGKLLPTGSLLEKQFKVNQHEFTHHPGADGHTTTRSGQTARLRSDCQTRPVRPPAPGAKALGPVSGTRERVCVTAVKLSASTHYIKCKTM